MGIGADVGGYVFEALALGVGTLVLVQPILSTSLLISLFLGGAINKRRITRSGWIAACVLAIGVAVFLYMVAPTEGIQVASNRSWLIAAPPIVGVRARVRRARRASRRGRRERHSSGSVPARCSGRARCSRRPSCTTSAMASLNWVPHWEPYALAVSSITGLVLAQSAFQTGGLAAAVSAEQVLQPLTGVALGVGLLDERLELSGPIGTVVVGAALIAMLGGVLMLARVENPDFVEPAMLDSPRASPRHRASLPALAPTGRGLTTPGAIR